MKILYFAWVREKAGMAEEEVSPPDSVSDVGTLIEWLRSRGDNYADALFDSDVVKVAVNQDYANLDYPVKDSDEVAFFPPVTGG